MVGTKIGKELQKSIDIWKDKGGVMSGTRKKRKIPVQVLGVEELRGLEKWSSNNYGKYYKRLMEFYKGWYNVKEGDRTVVIGQNLASYLEDGNVRRKCWCSKCLVPGEWFGKDRRKEIGLNGGKHIVIDRSGQGSLEMCWRCEYVCSVPIKGDAEKLSDPMASGFKIYADFGVRNLVNWDMVSESTLRGARTIYWRPAIRYRELRGVSTKGSWGEIVGINPVIDIDIKDKGVRDVLDYWNESLMMLGDVVGVLEREGLEFRIMFSGNGWYIILKKIIMKDKLDEMRNKGVNIDNISTEIFWNKVSKGISLWIKSYLVDSLANKDWNKYFNIEFKQTNMLKYLKSPLSIHQKFYRTAIPVDLNLLIKGKDEFVNMIDPGFVGDNFDKLLKVWE